MNKEIFTLDYMLAPPPMDQLMTWVCLSSITISILALGYIWLRKRYWLFQPSLIIFSLICLRIQLPALFFVQWASENLQNPWAFIAVTQLFPFLYLAAAIPLSYARDSMLQEFAARLKTQLWGTHAWPPGLMIFCLVMSILTVVVYCMYTPFKQSGLYALFFDPTQINVARASTWQSVDNRAIGYFLSWGYHIFSVLLIFGSIFSFVYHKNRVFQSPLTVFSICVGFVALAFTGNRGGLTLVTLTVLGAYYCAKRRMPSKVMLAIGMIVVFAAPAYLSLVREGQDWTLDRHFEYINTLILHRIFEVPNQMGILYVYDAQATGYSGASGFRLFAAMMGAEGESLQARIGNEYLYAGQYCNATAVFEYYKMMGLFGIPVTVIGMLCLDLFLLFLRRPTIALLPFVVFFANRAIQGSETTVTVLLMTGGFWLVPVLAFFSHIPVVHNKNNSSPSTLNRARLA
ncbi:MAG: hypothetical protein ABFC77_09710 [Thermoguttaceae bacterium]